MAAQRQPDHRRDKLHLYDQWFSAANDGVYDVIVSNPWGNVTSAPATLSVVFVSTKALSYEPPGPSSRRTGLVHHRNHVSTRRDRSDGRNVEFIEIYNSNPFFEDVSGYRPGGRC
jgi:hypothetical protein